MHQEKRSIPISLLKTQFFFSLKKIGKLTLKKLHLPSVCLLCAAYHYENQAICQPCCALFKKINHACEICHLPLVDAHFPLCGYCIKEKPAFDRVYTHYFFEEPLRSLLHQFKYYQALHLKGLLTNLMLEAIPNDYRPDCLIPVPMHKQRLSQRGFNQAAVLTKTLAKRCRLPYQLHLCEKIINTLPQVNLNRQQRQKNLRHAFVSKTHHYNHITLIDDLLTTGTTANELAKLLKQQGAKRVDVWCCARTAR